MTEPHEELYIKSYDSGGEVLRSIYLVAAQDRPCRQMVLPIKTIKTATQQSGVVSLFLQSFLILCVQGPIKNFTRGTPEIANQPSGAGNRWIV